MARAEKVDPWAEAVSHLRAVDPRWHPLIERAGPCGLRPKRDRFATLVRAIIGQQISTRAATTIDSRLQALTGGPHDPETILGHGETGLRSCGLSGVKARYVLNLCEAVRDGQLPLKTIHRLEDEAIHKHLTAIKGIGPWTAEMFLVFSLNRPDVLSVGDLGIRIGLRNFHELVETPSPAECSRLAEPWRPFRSIAMWYLWRSLDGSKSTT